MWMFDPARTRPWGAAAGISVGLSVLATGLVYASAQGSERRGFYATVILSSGIAWGLLWGIIGFAAYVILGPEMFAQAGVGIGPLAGSVFGCLIALHSRAAPPAVAVPALALLGATAGALIGLAGILEGFLDEGSFDDWERFLMIFATLGALGGVASSWHVLFAARRLTPSA